MASPRIEKFLCLADKAVKIRDSDTSWGIKHELVFSKEICEAISETKIKIDYSYPICSEEKDVRGFVDAVEEKAAYIRKALGSKTVTAKTTETKEDIMDELRMETEKLLALLKDRHSGLIAWNEFLHERLTNLHALTSKALGN